MTHQKEQDYLQTLRHTAEHILTQAVLRLYPDVLPAMGPPTEEGFYFDFDPNPKGEKPLKISEQDFNQIKAEMNKIIKADLPLRQEILSIDEARKLFKGNPYKQEWLDEIEQKGAKAKVYWTGEDFTDLCSGPHLESTGQVKAYELLSVAGAYWRGNENNKMLTRIYGTAFGTHKELNSFLHNLREAALRDHRKLGKQQDLFTFSDLVGAGLPLFTPKGTLIRNLLTERLMKIQEDYGYQSVTIPHITKHDLYVVSGHWEKFSNELFKIKSREGILFAMKPMNCPHHIEIFRARPRSYRELPQRYAEVTTCYRDEQSGELVGLARVRAFTQDDAHIFLRQSQIEEEINRVWDIVDRFYAGFNFNLSVRFSRHDPERMEKYLGEKKSWCKAEEIMKTIIEKRADNNYIDGLGEAAIYGPKIDFIAQDVLDREWQLGTIQLDFNLPERFKLTCTSETGHPEPVVMIHRAIMGTIDRFLAILIEHTGGNFPLWLAPVQARIIPIADRHHLYAKQISGWAVKFPLRVETDDRSETMQSKIRDAEIEKIPLMIILGDQEVKTQTITIRTRSGENFKNYSQSQVKSIILKLMKTSYNG